MDDVKIATGLYVQDWLAGLSDEELATVWRLATAESDFRSACEQTGRDPRTGQKRRIMGSGA
jgi:hypothetical protein